MKSLFFQYSLLAISSILAAVGQIFFKLGSTARYDLVDYFNFFTMAGVASYFIGLLLWIYCLGQIDLTVAYAFTLLTFVLVYIGGVFYFSEVLSIFQYVGLFFIVFGFGFVIFGS